MLAAPKSRPQFRSMLVVLQYFNICVWPLVLDESERKKEKPRWGAKNEEGEDEQQVEGAHKDEGDHEKLEDEGIGAAGGGKERR